MECHFNCDFYSHGHDSQRYHNCLEYDFGLYFRDSEFYLVCDFFDMEQYLINGVKRFECHFKRGIEYLEYNQDNDFQCNEFYQVHRFKYLGQH